MRISNFSDSLIVLVKLVLRLGCVASSCNPWGVLEPPHTYPLHMYGKYSLLTSFFFRHDLENTTDRSVAVVTSLATVLNRTFQTRSSSASSIIDKCPQFVSKEKRQNRIFGKAGVNKKAVTRQRHNFELKQYFQIKYCNHSMELIWGVAPQAYQCTCKYFKWSQAF